jgi:hypothetical protein
MEQNSSIKFCVKLKKTTTEMSEILECAYSEKCLSRTCMCLVGMKSSKRFRYKATNIQNGNRNGNR